MKIYRLKNKNPETNKQVVNFFSSLADETRLRILLSLMGKPKNVTEIHRYIGKDKITLSGISHQLKQLNNLGIIFCNKKGKEKFFQLSNDFCWCIIRDAFNHFGKKEGCKSCTKINKRSLK
jgi:DNA-binding transcriptional ArsR family regulator